MPLLFLKITMGTYNKNNIENLSKFIAPPKERVKMCKRDKLIRDFYKSEIKREQKNNFNLIRAEIDYNGFYPIYD